ncbi:uncharacterized protein LOC124409914 [Diprion similis]|uniref:uncharacterized protein LOC124409914 n=1 Tax=Diprion similis TaxID=362088 RepID=UPI001EF8C128|nr:uncharacterized protein LOC124409914 [Diprion similis]XP_046743826.1 uncharacterized protein LOC124409914 [Diprion similis]XP_046743827.1 uncharacterized protein LOC124409914 [Diprion similis]
MVDEVLPASLERLEIDRDSVNSSRVKPTDKTKPTNPFRITSKGIRSDTSYLFSRRSMPSCRPTTSLSSISAINPRGVKSTTNFKPGKHEKVLDKPNKKTNSIIKEAVLKLNNPSSNRVSSIYLSENFVSALREEVHNGSICSSKNCKTFGRGSVTKDFKALNISSRELRLFKDDARIDDNFRASIFRRTRSNTMPSLKREPGPGGGSPSPTGQNDTQNSPGSNQNSSSSTCSIQARISPPPCDVTIDELASYFDEFVHIPKKMSHMAEMMYI